VRNVKRQVGFTLIELMLAVAVVAILAGIAVPQYSDHLQRGRLTSGIGELKELRARMEQRYADNRTYANTAGTACSIGAFTNAQGTFGFACALTNAGQGFTWTATGTGPATGFVYTIDEAGMEVTTSVKPGWTATAMPANRFIVKKGS